MKRSIRFNPAGSGFDLPKRLAPSGVVAGDDGPTYPPLPPTPPDPTVPTNPPGTPGVPTDPTDMHTGD